MNTSGKMSMGLTDNWPEILAIISFGAGLVIALFSSIGARYFIMVLGGLFFGRLFYSHKGSLALPTVLCFIGFAVGFSITAFGTNRIALFILFVFSALLSYILHDRKIITSREL